MSDDVTVSQLMSMGFTRERVVHALEASCYNPDKAAGFLLSEGAPDANGAGGEEASTEGLWTNKGNPNMSGDQRIYLMLIGKTGNGKSSTGNSLVLRDDFAEGDGGDSETFLVKLSSTYCSGETLRIIDTPGLKDTRGMTEGEAMRKVVTDMKSSIGMCPVGVDCVVLVLRYGVRFTDEDKSTVENLKRIFGKVIFEKYCIVLFTHRDTFEKKQERAKQPETYVQWYEKQTGDLRELLQLCQNRVVFFDNYTQSENQRVRLVQMVQTMRLMNGDRYTNSVFAEAVAEHKKMVEEANLPTITTQVMEEITLLRESLRSILDSTDDHVELMIKLDELKERARKLLNDVEDLRYSQGVLDDVTATITDFVNNVGSRAQAENTAAKLEDQDTSLRKCVYKGIAMMGGGSAPIVGKTAQMVAARGVLGAVALSNPITTGVIAASAVVVPAVAAAGGLFLTYLDENQKQKKRDRARKEAEDSRLKHDQGQKCNRFEEFR